MRCKVICLTIIVIYAIQGCCNIACLITFQSSTSEYTNNKYMQLYTNIGSFKRCLLLYSGGLDTSVMLKWIQEQYNAEVVALTIDIGQTADDLNAILEKAIKLGPADPL